jgi:hypothetical protein
MPFPSLLRRILSAALASMMVGLAFLMPAPVLADAGRYLGSASYAQLTAELETLRESTGAGGSPAEQAEQRRRLADLQALQRAIAASDDRSQVSNRSSHSIGVFGSYKKEPASQPASFYVLGPGHSTDDDYELVGVYVPAGVSLRWDADGGAQATSAPRIARLLEGQQLKVTDPSSDVTPVAPPPVSAVTYQLSLPVFAVDASSKAVASLPSISQALLDMEPETAPLD